MTFPQGEARPTRGSIRWIVPLTLALLLIVTAGSASAAAKPKHRHFKLQPIHHAVTLQYFQRAVKTTFTAASGKALKPGSSGKAGDTLTMVTQDYVGTKATHAKKVAASGTISCVYSSTAKATCTNQIKVGSSEIDANKVPVVMGGSIVTFAVNGGSGLYQGAKGLITATAVGGSSNANLTIVVLPASTK